MTRKTMLLAVAALSALAFAALPSIASATPQVSFGPEDSRHFTIEGTEIEREENETKEEEEEKTFEEHATLTTASGRSVTCESSGGTGEFDETGETGSVQFEFKGCRESTLNSKCTTSGKESGTIATTTLDFHLKTATGDHTPAVLITSNSDVTENHFASFSCVGGFVKIVVKGNGIVGEITTPAYGVPSNHFGVEFKVNEEGTQTPDEVDETPEVTYGLESSTNGGAFEAATEHASGIGTFDEGVEPTLTTTPEE